MLTETAIPVGAAASSTSAAAAPQSLQQQQQVIVSHHADYILATAVDVYGRRLATASGDRCVRVWELQDDGSWFLCAVWQAHRSAVTAVTWAHAEFGSLLATTGADHDCKIWEEVVVTDNNNTPTTTNTFYHANANNNNNSNSRRWNVKASLTEARRGVSCVEFAPRHWGLKLATGSHDGCVRIYEAVDVMNLAQWPVSATLPAFASTLEDSPSSSLSSTSAATAAATTTVGSCTCLSWCTGRFDPPTLAVGGGSGASSHLLIYRYSDAQRAWQAVVQLSVPDILDVAWAPNVGRRYHSIAVATEHFLRIYKLSRSSTNSTTTADNNNHKELVVQATQDIAVTVWRCQWNVTGTVLASSGDVGTVQLYKCADDGMNDNHFRYECVSQIQGNLHQVAAAVAASGLSSTMMME